jgi:hypothetical protein
MHTMAKRAYYGRSVLERKLRAIDETDSLLAFVIALATDRYPTGKESLENIYKAQAAKAEIAAMRTMIRGDIVMKTIELANFLGATSYEFEIDTTLPLIARKGLNVFILSIAGDSFTVLREIDANIAMMQAKVKFESSALYPEFGISVNHMQSLSTMMPNQFSVMGMVSIPIAPWSRTEADAMTAGVDREIESLRLKRLAAIREQMVSEAMFAEQRQSLRLQLDEIDSTVLPAYWNVFTTALDAYRQNAGDLSRVIDAWQMVRMATMNRLDVLQSLINADISYEDATAKD